MFNKSKNKIFCISFQRTGTTSVGQFFMKNGYKVATYNCALRNNWSHMWFEGKYEAIINSKDFKINQVFEDDPWWCLDFYKYLYHKFPKSKFVLITRDSDKWFDSMVSHSNGTTLGNTYMHAFLYRREKEFYSVPNLVKRLDITDNLLALGESQREHYKAVYEIRNQEILDFFHRNDKDRLCFLKLEDNEKWTKLGKFFGLTIEPNFEVHANSSITQDR